MSNTSVICFMGCINYSFGRKWELMRRITQGHKVGQKYFYLYTIYIDDNSEGKENIHQ